MLRGSESAIKSNEVLLNGTECTERGALLLLYCGPKRFRLGLKSQQFAHYYVLPKELLI